MLLNAHYAVKKTIYENVSVVLNVDKNVIYRHFSGEETKYISEGTRFFCLVWNAPDTEELDKNNIKWWTNGNKIFIRIYIEPYASIFVNDTKVDINEWASLDKKDLELDALELHATRSKNIRVGETEIFNRYLFSDELYFREKEKED